jgi:hypothetical protein
MCRLEQRVAPVVLDLDKGTFDRFDPRAGRVIGFICA